MIDSRVSFIIDRSLSYKEEYLFERQNPVYLAVEKLLASLKLDSQNALNKNWNPLGGLIKPGDKVVIKPNLVTSRDKEKRLKGDVLLASSTNPAVILPLIDYAWKALKEKGQIRIIDAPLEGSDFEQMVEDIGLVSMVNFLKRKGVNLDLIDLRDFKMNRLMLLDNFILGNYSLNFGLLVKKKIRGDPRGYQVIDLGQNSFFNQKDWDYRRLTFHRSNPHGSWPHHNPKKNEYSIARTVLEADVFINVPKLKTHKKAGVTLSLKNLIGTTNQKYWLPHYRSGTPPLGDEYPQRLQSKDLILDKISRLPLPLGSSLIINIVKVKIKRPIITEGAWEGNDTIWRTILDLNKVFFFTDQKGRLIENRQRRYLTLVDGILAGEGNGPLSPTPKKCGLLIAGFNPVLVDLLAVKMMGFDYHRLKQITQGLKMFGVSQNQIRKVLNISSLNLDFVPPFGWGNLKLRRRKNEKKKESFTS